MRPGRERARERRIVGLRALTGLKRGGFEGEKAGAMAAKRVVKALRLRFGARSVDH